MNERNALAVAALTSVTWGLTGIFVRLLPTLSSLTISAGRLLIGLAVALPFVLFVGTTRQALRAALSQPLAYLLAALLAGYYLLATAAFQMAPVAEAALLLNTPPLFVIAFRWLQGRPPRRAEIGGALLAMSGMAMILVPKMAISGAAPDNALYGQFCAICAAALTALYATIYRSRSAQGRAPDAGALAVLTFAIGSALLISALLLAGTTANSGRSELAALDAEGVAILLALGVVSTAIPTLGFALASRQLSPMVTSMISLFIPLFAGFFAFLILGETISRAFMVGCLLVLGGAVVIIREGRTASAPTRRRQ